MGSMHILVWLGFVRELLDAAADAPRSIVAVDIVWGWVQQLRMRYVGDAADEDNSVGGELFYSVSRVGFFAPSCMLVFERTLRSFPARGIKTCSKHHRYLCEPCLFLLAVAKQVKGFMSGI
jgi:hypothetical protein